MTSDGVRRLLTSDMGHRYRADDQFYRGARFLDEVEVLGERIACEVFGANWASLRPLSGHSADMILVSTLCKPGDSILSVNPADGGYPGLSDQGFPAFFGLRNLYFPLNSARMNIDVEKTQALIDREKPRLVVFGQSFFLFPHPIKELVGACVTAGARVAYDGSHVLGLIAGGRFQQPLKEGVEVLVGSTHKSFFGPQGAIILGRSASEEVKNRQFPGLVDNAHWNRIAALAWALDEFKRNGERYASQVIANAKALARALHEGGLPVKCADYGFTESHQVILDIPDEREVGRIAGLLERANIIVDHGIRLGSNELTRRGMKTEEMKMIAELIVDVYKGKDPNKIRRQATRLRKEFNSIMFT